MGSQRITIKDIAREANVSETTVSRYLNGKFEYMAPKTRETIKKVVTDLDYRPNNIARTLKSQTSKIIGAVIADIKNPFSSEIIKGLTEQANEMGYSLMIAISNNNVEKEKESIERFLDNRVDGLVINTVGENEKYLEELANRLPIVFIDRGVNNFAADTVSSNNYELGIEMMEHLVENQFRSIGFFSEKIKNNTVRQHRYQAFKDVGESKKEISKETYIVDLKEEKLIIDDLDQFYQLPSPRVIFAGNGLILQSVLKIMQEKGYRLKKDFYICAYDDLLWTTFVGEDGITTIAQDSYALGSKTISLLCKKMEEKDLSTMPTKLQLKGHIVVRGSTKVM